MRKRKRRLLAIIIVLAGLGLGYSAYSLTTHRGANYLTVSSVKLQAESVSGQQVAVEGRVVPGSVDWDDRTKTIRFVLTDDRESLTIVYRGIAPDSFKPGADLVVEGTYRPDETFEARSIGSRRSLCDFCH